MLVVLFGLTDPRVAITPLGIRFKIRSVKHSLSNMIRSLFTFLLVPEKDRILQLEHVYQAKAKVDLDKLSKQGTILVYELSVCLINMSSSVSSMVLVNDNAVKFEKGKDGSFASDKISIARLTKDLTLNSSSMCYELPVPCFQGTQVKVYIELKKSNKNLDQVVLALKSKNKKATARKEKIKSSPSPIASKPE